MAGVSGDAPWLPISTYVTRERIPLLPVLKVYTFIKERLPYMSIYRPGLE